MSVMANARQYRADARSLRCVTPVANAPYVVGSYRDQLSSSYEVNRFVSDAGQFAREANWFISRTGQFAWEVNWFVSRTAQFTSAGELVRLQDRSFRFGR